MSFRPGRRDSVVALIGLLAGAAVATAVAVAAWPGSSHAGPSSTASGSSTAAPSAAAGKLAPDPVNETLRPKEIVLASQYQGPYTSGKIVLMPLRLTCGLSTIVGTHGEMQANGQYCLIRVALTADDTFTHTFDIRKTALTTTAGASVPVSYEAQQIKRQPLTIAPVGSHDRYEFDIYYDVPRDATVNGFTFTDGEGGPTVRAPLPVRVWPFS